MKLRNKKTGEIREDSDLGKMLSRYEMPSYESISKLCEEWEDYTPAEPLIKDEKIRKAVRAWWECCQEGIDVKKVYIKDGEFRMGIYHLDLGRYYFFDDKKEGFYTIAELCGEEEE